MRSGLGWRYHLCPTQGTLRLCRCLLMDVFTRMIRAWHLSQHLTQSLTLKPLEAALRQSVPEIHHSDQGVQYLSSAYISTLTRHGIEISLAQRGCPWENGYAERLIRTLKEEEVHLNDYEDITCEAKARIGHFITQVYHQKRPHSALGYLTPVECNFRGEIYLVASIHYPSHHMCRRHFQKWSRDETLEKVP